MSNGTRIMNPAAEPTDEVCYYAASAGRLPLPLASLPSPCTHSGLSSTLFLAHSLLCSQSHIFFQHSCEGPTQQPQPSGLHALSSSSFYQGTHTHHPTVISQNRSRTALSEILNFCFPSLTTARPCVLGIPIPASTFSTHAAPSRLHVRPYLAVSPSLDP